MRRAFLIFLAFAPALAAYLLFRSFDEQEEAPRIERINEDDSQEKKTINEALTGFSGKGTFYRRLAPIVLDGQELSYPSTYYLLDEWRRDGQDAFVIDGLLVLRNEKPSSLADLDANLLKISNDGSSQERRESLEAARASYDSLKAGRGRAVGGKTVAESDEFQLDRGVEARVPGREAGAGQLRINSEEAQFKLVDGRLDILQLPLEFQAAHPDYELRGIGLEAREASPEVTIASKPRIEARGLKEGEKRIIRAAGKLVWKPDPRKSGKNPDILDRVHFDFGDIQLEREVVFEIDDMVLNGDQARLRLGTREGAMSGKLTSFELEGAVSMVSPRGQVKAAKARGTILENGAITVVLSGPRNEVRWSADDEAPVDVARAGGMSASSSGPMEFLMPAVAERGSKPLVLKFQKEVVFDLHGERDPVHLEGEALTIHLTRVPRNRATTEEEEEGEEVWRFKNAALSGNAKGKAREYDFKAPLLDVTRRYDERGLHLDDQIVMEGPVDIEKTAGLGRDDPELRSFIHAGRRIELLVPASPFADGKATADGAVEIREKRGRKVERSLDCEHLEITSGPVGSALGEERRVLKTLLATGTVAALDEAGSTLKGDKVTWDRGSRDGRVEGRPAVATFIDGRDQKQTLSAGVLEFNSASGRVQGQGTVSAQIHFAALRFADDKAPKTDEERVMGRPPVLWNLSCDQFRARFTGTMPLGDSARGTEKEKAELADFDLIGSARVENPEQRILADELHYDLVRKTGTASGKPVKVRSTRITEDGQKLEDWLEAERLMIDPEWTLLSGSSRALLHLQKSSATADAPPAYEQLRVDSREDVLLKKTELVFTGRTHLVRGKPGEKVLDIQADQVQAFFAPDPTGEKPRGDLERIVGIGSVDVAFEDLKGEGEVLTYDYVAKKVVLEAKPNETCYMSQEGGFTARSEQVQYDMRNQTITQHRLKVERRRDPEKKP